MVLEAHALVRTALRTLISSTPGFVVVAEAQRVDLAIELAQQHQPDVILVGSSTLDGQEDGDLDKLRRVTPDACIIALARDGLAQGDAPAAAHGCLRPNAGVEELCATVNSLLGTRCAKCALRVACPVPRLAVALSRREREVAVRVARGMTSKQIAGALGIRLRTVNTYRESLARKLGASSAAVVTRFVVTTGLTDPLDPAPVP